MQGTDVARLTWEVAELRTGLAALDARLLALEVTPAVPWEARVAASWDLAPASERVSGAVESSTCSLNGNDGNSKGISGGIHNRTSPSDNLLSMSLGKSAEQPDTYSASAGAPGATSSQQPYLRDLEQRHHDDDTQYYTFRDSVWDAVLFVFSEPMGVAGSLFVLLLALACTIMQLGFVVIVSENFTGSNFNDESLADFRAWRRGIAHDAKHLDLISGSSLASRVCRKGEADGLNIGVRQAIALEAIDRYLPGAGEEERGFFGWHQGQLMCCLAVVVWLMSVTKEFRQILYFKNGVSSILQHGSSRRTTLVRTGHGWSMESISRPRAWLAGLTAGYRVLVALSLASSGILYLVKTIDMTELLLNAVSLELVLVVDELIYEALAPAQTWSLIKNLRSVPVESGRRWQGLDCRVVTLISIVIVGVLATYWGPLSHEVNRLELARDILCGGDTDFVFTRSFMPPYVQYASSSPYENDVTGYLPEVIQKIIDGRTVEVEQIKVPALAGSAWSLSLIGQWDFGEASLRYGQGCVDYEFQSSDAAAPRPSIERLSLLTMEALRWTLNNASLKSCASLRPSCNLDDLGGAYSRQLCPVTCGCHRPDSELLLDHSLSGCPPQCTAGEEYQQVLRTTPCADSTLAGLQADPRFLAYADSFLDLQQNWPSTFHEILADVRITLREQGCAARGILLQRHAVDVCSVDQMGLRALHVRCPRTCNCTFGMPYCPYTC